jgi:hypothetical protein
MRFLTQFIYRMMVIEAAAVVGLLLAGWGLTVVQGDRYRQQTFFTYEVMHLDNTPAWFVACLTLMVINGFWLFKLAAVEGGFGTPMGSPWGNWNVSMPINDLRIFAVNLVAIPALLGAFMVVRSMGW